MAFVVGAFERLEEVLQISLHMWDGDESPFNGTHYRMERPLNSPNSLQRPHPPILIGGGGEKKTLRLVARYGDMCNLVDVPGVVPLEALAHKLDVLRSHCEDAGRDYGEVEKTAMSFLELSGDQSSDRSRLLAHLEELAGLGFSNVHPRAKSVVGRRFRRIRCIPRPRRDGNRLSFRPSSCG